MKTYRVLSVCGSGIATSTLVARRLTDGLSERGIASVSVVECNVQEASGQIAGIRPDAVISTTALDAVELGGIRSFNGIPILMNQNAAALYDEIAEHLRSL
ncbi:MAG: hypothetical protein LBK98_00035 [Peptococcaceae bacterium]|nr:hypothetical protein [Peptococcaceae bacterium]